MKLRHGLATIVVVALLLPSLRASARTPPSDSSDEPQDTNRDTNKAAPAEPEETTKAAPPAQPDETTMPAPASAAYVPFAPLPSPLRIENPSASIQFGILLQPQLEVAGSPDADLTTKNLFLRRTRLIVGGTLFKYFEFFFDTDYPNLFKLDTADTMAGTTKNAPGLNIQDAFGTAKPFGELFMVDAGFMLPPLSHNSLESAAKLYGADYFVNSFRRNVSTQYDPFGTAGQNPVGRDMGIQLRGLVAGGHVEYRGGLFQGFRVSEMPGPPAVVGGLNFFRASLRLQINVLDAEPGFFHAGTYLGAKKILSFGGFYEFQDKYKYFGGDFFLDLPTGRAGVLTAQVDVARWDGGTFIMGLPKSTVYLAELGYLIGAARLSPIGEYERLVASDPTMAPSETRYGGGLAFWPFGYNSTFKAFFAHVHRDPSSHDFNQINVQWQLYYY